ncbi:trk system potassium uptake protein [Desulfosarcina sp. BuS5]|uniref:Trk system potassium transporter TrkA n=1 Tax=Desulfosarcina sp. BuS5 TaxID=933262 RepID=UPI000485D66A|nr:Trk system potassium transporter TrkA [Desulfosarcina sp. BuS5]WDN89629.1 trk system potassium uptake protein [Desulfosarcina sp. BuS5]
MKIIIVGAGEVGFHIASHLALENKDVVVIDSDPEAIRHVSDNIDVQTVHGSGSSPVILEEAGIKEAEIVLAVTNSDETNLVACLVSDIISPTTKKLARLRNADFDNFHDTFNKHAPHIDTLINPEIEVVKTIDRLMNLPGAVDIGEFADGRVKFVGIHVEDGTQVANFKLSEIFSRTGIYIPLIAAIIRNDELIIPTGNDKLRAGDTVYFISEDIKLSEALAAFGKHTEPVKRVLIVGGGRIGFRLARHLEKQPVYIKIIEKDQDRCCMLADRLNKTVVLHGDGSDQELLREENVQDIDIVITLTNDEETNILTSLLARKMGISKTITKISKFSYFPLMSMIGLEQIVNPRLSAINSILQHIRRGKVLSAISIKGDEAEVLEAVAMETSDIVDKPLKDISFPKGALITGIIHGNDIIIPSGSSLIEPGDRVIIFARKEAIPRIEKILAVKLEFF